MAEWREPPAGPRPGWTPTASRRRRPWAWILVGVCFGLVVLFGVGIALFVTIQKPVIDAANAWLDDVEDGNYDAAWDGLCEEDRDALGYEGFMEYANLGLASYSFDNPTVDFLDVEVDGDRASVTFDPDGDGTFYDSNYTLRLRKEDGVWKTCELADDGLI